MSLVEQKSIKSCSAATNERTRSGSALSLNVSAFDPRPLFPWDCHTKKISATTVLLKPYDTLESLSDNFLFKQSAWAGLARIAARSYVDGPAREAFHFARSLNAPRQPCNLDTNFDHFMYGIGTSMMTSSFVAASAMAIFALTTGVVPLGFCALVGASYTALTSFLGFRRGYALGKAERENASASS